MIVLGVTATVVVVLLVGLVVARRVDGDSTNFLVAGRGLALPLAAAGLMGQAVDSNATLGNTDLTYAFGFWAGAALPLGLAVCLLLTGLLFAGRMNRMGLFTLADFFRLPLRPHGRGHGLGAHGPRLRHPARREPGGGRPHLRAVPRDGLHARGRPARRGRAVVHDDRRHDQRRVDRAAADGHHPDRGGLRCSCGWPRPPGSASPRAWARSTSASSPTRPRRGHQLGHAVRPRPRRHRRHRLHAADLLGRQPHHRPAGLLRRRRRDGVRRGAVRPGRPVRRRRAGGASPRARSCSASSPTPPRCGSRCSCSPASSRRPARRPTAPSSAPPR